MKSIMNVIIAAKDQSFVDTIKSNISSDHCKYFIAKSGNEALDIYHIGTRFQLIILDEQLKDCNCLHLCRSIRDQSEIPIIVMSEKPTVDNEIACLTAGACDYIKKDVDPRILLARVRSVARKELSDKLVFLDIVVYQRHMNVFHQNVRINLTPKEFELLLFLFRNRCRILKREQILNKVWGRSYNGSDRTIDTHIKWLRKKIPILSDKIRSITGMGYIFDLQDTDIKRN